MSLPRIPADAVTVKHGKGKSIITGPVLIQYTDHHEVCVSTDGYFDNDKPPLTFRGQEWLVTVYLTRRDDGTWEERDKKLHYGIGKRGCRSSDGVPRTYREAIITALVTAVGEAWTPEKDNQAVYTKAARELAEVQAKRDKVSWDLVSLDARIFELNQIMAGSGKQD